MRGENAVPETCGDAKGRGTASARSPGLKKKEACSWRLGGHLPKKSIKATGGPRSRIGKKVQGEVCEKRVVVLPLGRGLDGKEGVSNDTGYGKKG